MDSIEKVEIHHLSTRDLLLGLPSSTRSLVVYSMVFSRALV
jgi:hypothetical protein